MEQNEDKQSNKNPQGENITPIVQLTNPESVQVTLPSGYSIILTSSLTDVQNLLEIAMNKLNEILRLPNSKKNEQGYVK